MTSHTQSHGHKNASPDAAFERGIPMQLICFCLIPYYEYYDGTEASDDPACMNFLPVDIPDENRTHELLFGALPAKKTLPASISASAEMNGGIVSDATVVFCAKADNGSLVTVGLYMHANVTPNPELLPMADDAGNAFTHPFFFCTHRQNGVLLPPDERFKPPWQIPRGKNGNSRKFGFSGDPFWLCDEPAAASWKHAFYENLLRYTKTGDNMLIDPEA